MAIPEGTKNCLDERSSPTLGAIMGATMKVIMEATVGAIYELRSPTVLAIVGGACTEALCVHRWGSLHLSFMAYTVGGAWLYSP